MTVLVANASDVQQTLPGFGWRGHYSKKGERLSARGAQQQQIAENGDRGKGCEGTGQAAHATTIAGFAALRNGGRAGENALRPAGAEAGDQPRRRLSASQPDQT
jgi:hypothetical protein